MYAPSQWETTLQCNVVSLAGCIHKTIPVQVSLIWISSLPVSSFRIKLKEKLRLNIQFTLWPVFRWYLLVLLGKGLVGQKGMAYLSFCHFVHHFYWVNHSSRRNMFYHSNPSVFMTPTLSSLSLSQPPVLPVMPTLASWQLFCDVTSQDRLTFAQIITVLLPLICCTFSAYICLFNHLPDWLHTW